MFHKTYLRGVYPKILIASVPMGKAKFLRFLGHDCTRTRIRGHDTWLESTVNLENELESARNERDFMILADDCKNLRKSNLIGNQLALFFKGVEWFL
jgi:hypothetical protein